MGNANGVDNDCRMSGNCMRFLLTLTSYTICRWGSLLLPPFLTLEKTKKLFDTSNMDGSFLTHIKRGKSKQPAQKPHNINPPNPNFSQVSVCGIFRFSHCEDNFQKSDDDSNPS